MKQLNIFKDSAMNMLRQVSAIIILLLFSASLVAQTQFPTMPTGKAPNLIVFVHGCCTDIKDLNELRKKLSKAYKPLLQKTTEWEIVVFDWTSSMLKPPGLIDHVYIQQYAYPAYINAFSKGQELAGAINQYPIYQYIHLIAHSAGAKLIDEAAKKLALDKQTKNQERPFIHLTFLDAYTPLEVDKSVLVGSYGSLLNDYLEHYSEHYVHKGFPYTDETLPHAFNFDITRWGVADPLKEPFGHLRPLNWYIQSITAPKPEFKYLKYGHPLSREGGNQFINVMGKLYPPPSTDPLDPNKGLITLVTYPPAAGVPIVTKVNFPSSILGDGVSVNGTVEFKDPDASVTWGQGVTWAQFDVLGDTCSGCFQPFGFDPGVIDLRKGKFDFYMWCTAPGFSWTMKLTLRDEQNKISNPYTFSIACTPPLGAV